MIRKAQPEDATEVAAIWNAIIRDTAVTFNPDEKPLEEVEQLIAENCIVAIHSGRVAGFARFFAFRGGAGYRFTCEHTIMLAPQIRGKGMGSSLLEALMAQARADGMSSMIAGCSAEAPAAIKFHAAMGFEKVATLPKVGFKFERWIDLVLMQRFL